MLAANIMAVGFGNGSNGYLSHLCPPADDDDAFAVNPLKALYGLNAFDDGEGLQVALEIGLWGWQHDLEINPGIVLAVFEDLDGCDISLMLGNNASQTMQHAKTSPSVHQNSNSLGAHQPATTAIIFSRILRVCGAPMTIRRSPAATTMSAGGLKSIRVFSQFQPGATIFSWAIVISVGQPRGRVQ